MASVDLQEKVNFTRLSRLLVDKGTEALRNTFDGIHPPASLPAVLNANKTSLLRLKPRVINNSQWNLLYPPSGDPADAKTFDVTLLTVLFRNICGFSKTGWSVMPVDTDRSTQANIVRIKSYRNEVYAHVTSTQVDDATFESLWQKISQALIELNIPQNDVDNLKICPLALEEEIYIRVLKDWKLREEECIAQEQEVLKELTHLRQIAEESRDGINKILTLHDKKELPESPQKRLSQVPGDSSPENKRCKQDDDDHLRKLAKCSFKTKIKRKVEFFMPETRKWLFKEVNDWFLGEKNGSRILVLKAGPGFGKSVFAAKLCEDFKKNGKLAACHFCDFSDSNYRNPMMMLQSLASQMCENIHGFKEKLLDQLKRPHKVSSLKDAFGVYLQNPLDELEIDELEPLLIVIDGLDESSADDKNDIVNLVADYFPDLPDHIRVLVTSRPEISLAKLNGIHEIDIGIKDANNESDIAMYLKYFLPSIAERNDNSSLGVLKKLVSMCEGSFLYAFHVQCELKKRDDLNMMTVQEILNIVPKSLYFVYQKYFQRLEDEFKALREDIDVMKLLEVFVAAKGALPLSFVPRALGLVPDCRKSKTIIQKVNVALSCLLYVSDDLVTVFHKSVIDWLLAKGYQDHQYVVKISNGDKLLWQISEKVFEEIKEVVCSGRELDFNNEVKYALEYGFVHLLACDMKKCLYWLVDVVIIHAILSISHRSDIAFFLCNLWKDSLRFGAVESDELRARIAWHILEMKSIESRRLTASLSSLYLESVLARSPKGCFGDDEKNIVKSLLSKTTMFVDLVYDEVEVIPHAIWCSPTTAPLIVAAGMSKDKAIVALAQMDGTITVLGLPSLVELWQYSTEYRVPCCTFAPDDSVVLFGKLETALSIAEKREIPFFHGNQETFKSCTFSPNGKKLATCDRSKKVKLWDVGKQNLLSLIYHEVAVDWCSFDNTGLLIAALTRSKVGSCKYQPFSFCVWNAVTLQRCDMRPLPEPKFKSGKASHSQLCKSCFRPGFKKTPTFDISAKTPFTLWGCKQMDSFTWSTGMYNGVECMFVVRSDCVSVIESIHFTTLAVWNFNSGSASIFGTIYPEMKPIKDDRWLYASTENLIVFGTLPPPAVCPTQVLSCSFSPDGSKLATCTSDGCINIWNVHTRKVEQRSKHGEGNSSFACWWSEKFFFVFEIVDKIPRLSKYSVDVNLKIMLSRRQHVPLCHLANELMSQLSVVSFSEGFLCFNCGKTNPVIVDVSKDSGPQMVTLPRINPYMSITVSPGASFIVGVGYIKSWISSLDTITYYIWKRNTEKPAVYELHCTCLWRNEGHCFGGASSKQRRRSRGSAPHFYTELDFSNGLEHNWGGVAPPSPPFNYATGTCVSKYEMADSLTDVICCFTNDSKVVFIASEQTFPERRNWRILDLNTGVHRDLYSPFELPISKLFYLNNDRVVIAVSPECITFLDMESGAVLGQSFQPYLDGDFLKQTKLSPNETVIAYPRVNGDMKFLRLFEKRLATNTGPKAMATKY